MPNDDDDDGRSTNPFARFKHQVDAAIGSGLQSIFGLPSFVTQGFDPRATRDPGEASRPSAVAASSSPRYGGRDSSTSSYTGPGPSTPSASSPSHADDETAVHPPLSPSRHERFDSAALEATIDSLSDGSLRDHVMAWDLFLRHSSYSPDLLQSTLGHGPPRPRDLPADLDASHLKWADAFEDLLTVSSGRPPLDMAARARAAKMEADFSVRTGFPPVAARNPGFAAWPFSAGSLSHAYLPVDDREQGYRSPRTMKEWVQLRAAEARARRDWLPLPWPGAGVLSWESPTDPWFRVAGTRSGHGEGKDQPKRPLDDLMTLAALIQGAVGFFDEVSKPMGDPSVRERRQGALSPVVPEAIEAKTEQDLYESCHPSTSNHQLQGKGPDSGLQIKTSWSTESTSTTTDGDKTTTTIKKRDPSGTTVKTVAEFVDDEGRRHLETMVQKTDPQGHVTTDNRNHFVQTAGQWKEIEEAPKELSTGDKDIKNEASKKDGPKGGGWFW